MTSLLPRSTWTDAPRPVKDLVRLDPSVVKGFAVHYTGNPGTMGDNPTLAHTCQVLEAERSFHVNGRGWSDIAYLGAVDQAGRVFDCRGAAYRSAANGDQARNQQWGALTWLGGTGDTPTPAAVEGIRWWRDHVWLPLYPQATRVVGHRDLIETDCPGDPMYHLVDSGTLLEDGAMPTADEIVTLLLTRLAAAPYNSADKAANGALSAIAKGTWAAAWPAKTPDDPDRTESAQDRLVWAARQTVAVPVLADLLDEVKAVAAKLGG